MATKCTLAMEVVNFQATWKLFNLCNSNELKVGRPIFRIKCRFNLFHHKVKLVPESNRKHIGPFQWKSSDFWTKTIPFDICTLWMYATRTRILQPLKCFRSYQIHSAMYGRILSTQTCSFERSARSKSRKNSIFLGSSTWNVTGVVKIPTLPTAAKIVTRLANSSAFNPLTKGYDITSPIPYLIILIIFVLFLKQFQISFKWQFVITWHGMQCLVQKCPPFNHVACSKQLRQRKIERSLNLLAKS